MFMIFCVVKMAQEHVQDKTINCPIAFSVQCYFTDAKQFQFLVLLLKFI